jgi:hypothetical protein
MRNEFAIDPGELKLHYSLQLAGAFCRVTANSDTVVDGLKTWIVPQPKLEPAFSLQVFVRRGNRSHAVPHFRGRKHLVIASFGMDNVFTFDLLRRNVTAVITQDVAVDQAFWDRVLLPIALGVLGPAFGVVPVHCACLVIDGAGVLIAGASGAGKSTLSVALAQNDFGFVSDDWTYLSLRHGRLMAHGLSVPAKLLPDALNHFPVLQRFRPGLALNQEWAYELPVSELGTEATLSCEPRYFFFLERDLEARCEIVPIASRESQQYAERSVECLPSELQDMLDMRSAVINTLPRLSCWKLTYGGAPTVAVQGLQEFFSSQRQSVLA